MVLGRCRLHELESRIRNAQSDLAHISTDETALFYWLQLGAAT
jgi:hypothetical protein